MLSLVKFGVMFRKKKIVFISPPESFRTGAPAGGGGAPSLRTASRGNEVQIMSFSLPKSSKLSVRFSV